MKFSNEDLKKKIIYRSSYRGSKEMDILMSSFVNKYINALNNDELIELTTLLDLDDENLYKFNKGEETSLNVPINKITDLFKSFNIKEK